MGRPENYAVLLILYVEGYDKCVDNNNFASAAVIPTIPVAGAFGALLRELSYDGAGVSRTNVCHGCLPTTRLASRMKRYSGFVCDGQ